MAQYFKWRNRVYKVLGRASLHKTVTFGAACLSICGVLVTLLQAPATISQVILTLYICFLMVIGWLLVFMYKRQTRYCQAFPHIHEAIHQLRDASFLLQTGEGINPVSDHIKSSLKSLAAAFTIITGETCRACIKQLYCLDQSIEKDIERNLVVTTLYRTPQQADPSDTDRDYVTDNSDFLALFTQPSERCFFSNNLCQLPGYKNSHWTTDTYNRGAFPYLSTIVWPVRKVYEEAPPGLESYHPKQNLLGYCCIDCWKPGVFLIDWDFAVGAAYADALYGVLRELSEKQKGIQEVP
ncbi:MAG: hypothetical protein NTW27_08445 [Deltaproteobacteria bacterium]|nr:hypothetical protein [Deltaproteobacteria bacterium]